MDASVSRFSGESSSITLLGGEDAARSPSTLMDGEETSRPVAGLGEPSLVPPRLALAGGGEGGCSWSMGSSCGTTSGLATDPGERTLVSTGPAGGAVAGTPFCLAKVLQGAIISERDVTADLTSSKIIHAKPNAKEKNAISQIEKILLRRVGASSLSNWQHNRTSETLL